MQSISAPPSPTINSDQSNPFRVIASNGVLRDEADVPYDGQTKAERSRRMVTTEQPLIVLPQLAVKIGLDEAIFVQQVYYWTSGPKAQVRDGFAWVYNSITDWREQFPFWSRSHLARVIASARKQGVVIATDDYNQHPSDRTYWYRVNPDHPALSLPNQQIPESGYGQGNGQKPAQPSQIPDAGYALPKSRIRNGQIPESERPNPESGTTLPETTTETTQRTTPPLPPTPANPAPAAVAASNGQHDDYVTLIGDGNVQQLASWLTELDRNFGGPGWVRNTLRDLQRDVPGLTAPQLKAGMTLGYERFETQFQADRASPQPTIRNPQGLARRIFQAALGEQLA